MGKKKKPKQEVVAYGMSIHFGICSGPVDNFWTIFAEEKVAWTSSPVTGPLIAQGDFVLDNKNLFGGEKKEGGLQGTVTWLPGAAGQVMPESLAVKFGRTSATMPAYRGITSIFFSGPAHRNLPGFYWRANSPYLPGVWIEVGRASIGLSAGIARIFRSLVSLTQPGHDFGSLGTGGDEYQWDTNGNWCVRGESATQVFTLPGGDLRTIAADPGSPASSIVHITDDGELFRRVGGDLSGIAPTFFEVRNLSDSELSVTQSISLKASILAAGGTVDLNFGFAMDDIRVGATRYALAWLAPAQYNGPWMLLSKSAGAWSIEWAQPETIALPSGYAIATLSMGPEYAYGLASNTATQIVLVHWSGTFSAAYTTPPGLAGRSIRVVHYFENTDEVIVVCINGDILVYNAAVTTLKRSKTGNGAGLGSPAGMLAKRMDLGANRIALPETGIAGVDWIRIVDVPSLAFIETITVADTGFVNPDVNYTWCGINRTWGGAFMATHIIGPTSFWFFAPIGKFDSNPAHIVYECLTNANWGMGAPSSAIDVDSFEAAAAVLYGENFGLSMIWTQQSAIEDFITEVLDHIEATLFVNPRNGLLTLKLIRFDYSIPALPVFTPDNSMVTNFSRKLWGETINEIVATWTNPDNEEEETVVAQDLANIEAQGGVISDGRNYYGVRRPDLAARLAHRDLRSASTPLAKCDIEVNRTAWDLLPGDCCVLDSPEDGIDSIVMRVGPVDYGKPGDSTVRTSLVEDVFSLALADYTEPPESLWVDTSEDPSAADHTKIVTLPYYLVTNLIDASIVAGVDYPEVFAGVLAAEGGQDSETFELLGQVTNAAGGTSYTGFGTKNIASRATLADALAAEVETTILSFPSRTQGNGPVVGGLMLIEGTDETTSEICLVSDLGVSGYTFVRGVLDTVPRAWPMATPVWFVDGNMAFVDDTIIRSVAETVNYKILPSTSRGTLDDSLAPVVSAAMTARPHLPLRPADVTVNGDDGFAGTIDCIGVDPIPVTWARRNRETETAIIKSWTDGDVTPEAGQTTTITLTDTAGGVLHTYSGIAGTSHDVDVADFGGASEGYIVVSSARDGLESLQAWRARVLLMNLTADATTVTADNTSHSVDES